MKDKDWVEFANCRDSDPDLFFPGRGEAPKAAKMVCEGCSVKTECLEWALANYIKFGVWGGLGERGRRRIRSERLHAARRIAAAREVAAATVSLERMAG